MSSADKIIETTLDNSAKERLKDFFSNFPIVRGVSPSLIAQKIISVQPMKTPVGSIFYLDLKYGVNHALNKKIKLAGLKKKVCL
jgi:hypothetical protein